MPSPDRSSKPGQPGIPEPSHILTKHAKQPTADVVIDALSFPHIMDLIFRHASYQSLLRLQRACKAYRDAVDKRLATHIVLARGEEPASAAGRMPAFGSDGLGQRVEAEKALLPFASVLDIKSVGYQATDLGWKPLNSARAAWTSNVQVLRLHMTHFCIDHLPHISPTVVVYTKAAMADVFDSVRELLLPRRPLPSSAKIVLNVPWSPSDFLRYDQRLFMRAQHVVAIFTPELSSSRSGDMPDAVGPLLRAYARYLRVRRDDAVAMKKPRASLTLVDIPPKDLTLDNSLLPRTTAKGRYQRAITELAEELAWDISLDNPGFPVDEIITDILPNVQFLTRKQYQATVSREQYILEPAADARDCF